MIRLRRRSSTRRNHDSPIITNDFFNSIDPERSPAVRTFCIAKFFIRSPRLRARGAWPARRGRALGGLEVDDELEFRRLHHLQVSRAVAAVAWRGRRALVPTRGGSGGHGARPLPSTLIGLSRAPLPTLQFATLLRLTTPCLLGAGCPGHRDAIDACPGTHP
jgi:hypothetical protein